MSEEQIQMLMDTLLAQYEKEGILRELVLSIVTREGNEETFDSPRLFLQSLSATSFIRYDSLQRLFNICQERSW